MASVASLGVHPPVGLRHAIEEGILPADPPASSYTWDVVITTEDGREHEDEILTTHDSVVWSRGGVFRRSFRFDPAKEPVTQALLAYFPAPADRPGTKTQPNTPPPNRRASSSKTPTSPSTKTKPALSRALVIFLKSQAHIYFLAGASHVVHMPFEVESACATPRGVIIQRKLRADTTSVSLRLPKVPPASFLSSQPPALFRRSHGHSLTEFSTEGLGNPKVLPMRLSSTLENMWQQPMEATDSHWPRLVCLTDPLLELGLVVTHPDPPPTGKGRKASPGPLFLSRSEEILHVQAVRIPHVSRSGFGELTIAVTINRETNMYTIWRLTSLEHDDPFLGPKKKGKLKPSRRRSSMAPGMASGTTTPIHATTRESFGAPLPGKKSRKSVKIDDKDKTLENALSSLVEDPTRRQSRRVSSLLARADLSSSQDRAPFTEQSMHAGHGSKRAESHGSQRLRLSSGYGGPSFGATFNYNRINQLPEAPVDNLLQELRAGGDFEGFHNMGLDDNDFDGLVHEMLLTKIQSVAMDNTNVRYSMSSKPGRTQAKVFVLAGPPTATDDQGRAFLLVAIQDPVDKRLQLLTLHLEHLEDQTPTKVKSKHASDLCDFRIIPGEPRRVQSVVDSCKLSDGNETIMILSEDRSGGRELSLQSPWGKVTTLALPPLLEDNLSSLEYSGVYNIGGQADAQPRSSFALSGTQIDAICHPNSRGVVDLRDKDGRHHRVKIQLQPSSPQVGRVLDVCRSVLHASYADKMVAGWWQVMQWLQDAKRRGLEHPIANMEWSAAVILLVSSFLALGHNSETSLRTLGSEIVSPAAKDRWGAMQLREAPNSSACPPWMRNKAWQWLLDAGTPANTGNNDREIWPSGNFIPFHVALAKRWMASAGGLSAFGFEGYLPTALNRTGEPRNVAAWSLFLAMHLLVEEQKLNILASEHASPGQNDLKTLLWQISRWLGWKRYAELYALGLPAEPSSTSDFVPILSAGLVEPPSEYCVLTWIQGHIAMSHGSEYPTLSDLYATATRDGFGGRLRTQLWEALTPRTAMFEKLFARIESTTNPFEVVVAMHECGFTPQVLETLPEAVLTPLQDVISLCQPNPPPSWPHAVLALVNRTDMSGVLQPVKTGQALGSDARDPSHVARWDFRTLCQHLDGLDQAEDTGTAERQAVVRSLFREDRRLNEAQSLLATNKHRFVRLDPKPEWTEAEFLEKQKELVTTMATSTLAIPAGRGLLYFALRHPLLTQKYQIPGFTLTCVVKPVNNSVSVDKGMFVEEKINWAYFHQGVAGGLAISPDAKGIDTSWILYNKPGQDLSNRHAGFLLALGLNGHLKSVAKWVAFKYLTPKHTMTTIGLLLGLAASYVGTMDALMTRLLSVHITRMLPRGAADLNLSTATQTTGVMGIGLVYCNSQHRRMSEIMLSEIEHVGSEEEEEEGVAVRDESYRLAAGFALGFINLGKGGDLRGLRDMQLTEKLLTMATATKRMELVHVLDWSAAGAVVAITLIYMKSEDQIVARKIDVPDSLVQFDYVRPDILLLRTVAKNLILWSEVEPTFNWVKNSLPSEYRPRFELTAVSKLQSKDLPFFSILAGLCFALGLRFAGSADERVRDLLVHYLDQFIRIVRIPVSNYDSALARSNACICMDVLALSCATVMAGTGDVVVLRRLRALHGRDDAITSYGSHMAAHLAIGALFLGSGTATFGTSDLALAALLVAFYPVFPATVQDNRSHLQAFRHFWVLATEPRCLVTKDLATGQPLNTPILIHLAPSASTTKLGDTILRRQTPCLLPPLSTIARVQTDASTLGYWDITLDFAASPHLRDAFRANQTVHLRRRPAAEGAFVGALRTLGSGVLAPPAGGEGSKELLSWLFTIPSLSGLTGAERGVALERVGSGAGAVGEGEGASTAVDARLVLKSGLEDGAWERDRLLGLRLLFEWGERRGVFLGSSPSSASGEGGENAPAPAGGEEGTGKKKTGKGTKTAAAATATTTGRGKKKVSLGVPLAEGEEGEKEGDVAAPALGPWWLGDGAIEELKGRAWLAGPEGP